MLPRNRHLAGMTQSHIRRMTWECDRLHGINLGQGVCDLPTPPEILRAAADAILADESAYSRFEGRDDLRRCIAAKAAEYNGLTATDPDENVVVTVGSTGAFCCALHSLFEPGDEILVFEPFYGYHVHTMRALGLVPVPVPLLPPRWELQPESLRAAANPRTRGILVNTPANPSGKVFRRADLEAVAECCQRHDLLALTDEIYEYIVYDRPHLSLASLPGMWERTVTVSGFSKTFSITGWRVGYAIAPAPLSRAIGLANDLFSICAPTPLQAGLARAMTRLEPRYYTELAVDYRRKRDRFCAALRAANLAPAVPEGAYYVLADATSLGGTDDIEAAMNLLHAKGIAAIPGSAFFQTPTAKPLLRFCFAKDWPVLEEACRRLEDR
ncbi:MAG: aminotransferase class I/II-fold pyridoxal phosphate-dependent enzyme [Lentisphaeria bacterium]|nr:aminotransferase class I/II-fold pyridoxal phosphate-dependent enzyme [Lentisphaeria bacterium]